MIVAEITRNTLFVSNLTPFEPFIWTGFTHRYVIKSNWEETEGDIFTIEGRRIKVQQVTRGYLTKYVIRLQNTERVLVLR